MVDAVEIIRSLATEIADQFSVYADHHAAKNAMEKSLTNLEFRNKALEIVDQLGELAALHETALDLRLVPEDWSIGIIKKLAPDVWYISLSRPADGIVGIISLSRTGPTPSAALAAAITRIGK